MQYWLLDWGSSACPSGWTQSGTACYQNTKLMSVPSVPITELGQVGLSGSAAANGLDGVTFVYGNDSWYLSGRIACLIFPPFGTRRNSMSSATPVAGKRNSIPVPQLP
jgi:hypothetical protein